MDEKLFEERLTRAIGKSGMTIQEIGKKANVNGTTIAYWLVGKTIPQAITLAAVAKALEVSTDWLLGLEQDYGEKHPTIICPHCGKRVD